MYYRAASLKAPERWSLWGGDFSESPRFTMDPRGAWRRMTMRSGDKGNTGRMMTSTHERTSLSGLLLGAAMIAALATPACRITEDDVARWGSREQGPRRLVAVLTHDKYATPLRVDAAMTLVHMKPRGGRQVGLQGNDEFKGLIDALAELTPESRAKLIEGMVPKLEAEISQPPAKDGPDKSYQAKDAAFALLTLQDGALVADGAMRARLMAALTKWANTSFSARLDDTSQLYGMEQVLRLLKADGVRGLTAEIQPGAKKIDTVSRLIDELGDPKTKLDASTRLVKVAEQVDSEAWLKQKAPQLDALNKASKLKVNEAQFKAQLDQYQEEELMRVFTSMKSVGEKPVVDYLLGFAQNTAKPEKRRTAALAALEGNLDKNNPETARILLDLISNEATPDGMRDVAAKRIGELSREQVVERLYANFDSKRWQIRWISAGLILRMSEAKHLDEFMTKIGKTKDMALSEPLGYGPLLHDLKGAKPTDLVAKYSAKQFPVQNRLTALSYWFRFGDKKDLAQVEPFAKDEESVPKCLPDAKECTWECAVTVGNASEMKPVKTVGDFVEYCIKPALSAR